MTSGRRTRRLMGQTISYASKTLGRPAAECMYLAGLYGPPDPPMAQAYGLWLADEALLDVLLGVRSVLPQQQAGPAGGVDAGHGDRDGVPQAAIARAVEVAAAVDVVAPTGGALNRFKCNEGKLNV